MNKTELMLAAFASFSSVGDIFTDADECAASVAAVENLAVLAGMLSRESSLVAHGSLMADGEFVCNVSASASGYLTVSIPEGFDTSGREWALRIEGHDDIGVAMFVGDCADDESWVVDDAEAFYGIVLHDPDEAQAIPPLRYGTKISAPKKIESGFPPSLAETVDGVGYGTLYAPSSD